MSWTDERVARLSKLWADGLSASQIAADLGGVTRNAVIGKVHRLGLSGRAKPAGKSGGAARRKTTKTRSTGGGGGSRTGSTYARASSRSAGGSIGNAALKMDMGLEAEVNFRPVEKPVEDVVLPISRKLDLLQLTESTCKWPTGDPTMPGFSFCGHKSKDEKPYCEFHSKLAYQPPSERRRRR